MLVALKMCIRDRICAGVSALVINFINSAEELCHAKYSLDTDEETGMIDYRLETPAQIIS